MTYDHIDTVYENIVRFPAGTKLFRAVESVGSSGGRDIKHFQYVGDVMDDIRQTYPDFYERAPIGNPIEKLLYEYFDVDPNKLEHERRAFLSSLSDKGGKNDV